ncbi:MAG: CHAT domain-containing protein, partial [Mycobacteriaceae bacterium]|nr:CHAT domain-containing protein [Mycobacteriaceae bacterium]
SLVHAPGRTARRWADAAHLPVAAILDPKVPGFRANSALGSVLGRMSGSSSLASRVESYRAAGRFVPTVADALDAFRRTDTDREWLGAALRGGVGRLIYVGHVTAAPPAQGRGEQAEMHLSCTESTLGFATPVRGHRPLSAMDLLLGTTGLATSPVAGRELWPIPSRVALIACESGGDLRFTEALGLVAAMVHGGAELVTATRWPLPTDHAFRLFAGTDHTPLHDAVLAVDAAHEQTDALAHLAAWQRARLHAWRTTRSPADSPVLWAAFTTVTT